MRIDLAKLSTGEHTYVKYIIPAAAIGTRLFERHGRGVRLTTAGTRIVQRVEDAFHLLQSAGEPWPNSRGNQIVRVSVLPAFAKLWLMPPMQQLQGTQADLRIELVLEHRFADFDGDKIDIAIRYGHGNWAGLSTQLLFREQLVPVASRSVAAALGQRPKAKDIWANPLIHDSEIDGWRTWLAGQKITYRSRAIDRRFEDYDVVLAAAEAGMGIALLRRPLADAALESKKLIVISDYEIAKPKAHYIVRRTHSRSAGADLLVERLAAVARLGHA
jgi:LysR family transcriptional regulator, glycine cleavage system transcriptional activator